MPGLGWPIGEYDLQRAIANGRFGTVYEAVSATRGTVAIKLIPSSEGREKIEAERRGAMLQQQFGADSRRCAEGLRVRAISKPSSAS